MVKDGQLWKARVAWSYKWLRWEKRGSLWLQTPARLKAGGVAAASGSAELILLAAHTRWLYIAEQQDVML